MEAAEDDFKVVKPLRFVSIRTHAIALHASWYRHQSLFALPNGSSMSSVSEIDMCKPVRAQYRAISSERLDPSS